MKRCTGIYIGVQLHGHSTKSPPVFLWNPEPSGIIDLFSFRKIKQKTSPRSNGLVCIF